MIIDTISILAVVILLVTSLFLLVSRRWRWCIIALAIQYLAAFWLVGLVWTLALAVIKLVVGWMSAAVLGASQPTSDFIDEKFPKGSGLIFRLLAAVMVWTLVFSLAPSFASFIPSGMTVLWGGLLLIGSGLLHLGMTTYPSRVIIGLLTFLSGFEIIYAAIESSVLVAGLLALVNLALALVGSYLLAAPTLEESA